MFLHYISGYRLGHLDVVRYLVTEARCDPNVRSNDGWTPLHWGSRLVSFLLENVGHIILKTIYEVSHFNSLTLLFILGIIFWNSKIRNYLICSFVFSM